jgi:hypothetical protein
LNFCFMFVAKKPNQKHQTFYFHIRGHRMKFLIRVETPARIVGV